MLQALPGLGAGLLLSLATLHMREAVRYEPPLRAAAFVTFLGAVLLAPVALGRLASQEAGRLAAALAWFGAAGLFGQLAARFLLYLGMARLGAATATAYKTASPLLTAPVAWLLFGERIGLLGVVGVAVLVAGLVALVRAGSEDHRAPGFAGPLIGLACAASNAASELLRKAGALQVPDPVTGTWAANGAALLALAAWAAVAGWRARGAAGERERGWPGDLARWHPRALGHLAVAGSLITAAYVLFLVGVNTAGVAVTSALQATEPLFVVLFSLVLGRGAPAVDLPRGAGIMAIVAGVALLLMR